MDASTAIGLFAVPLLMLLGMLGTVIIMLLRVGGFVARVEGAAKRIETIEERLERIPQIDQALTFVVGRLDRLEGRHDSTRAHAIRAEAISSHDFGGKIR